MRRWRVGFAASCAAGWLAACGSSAPSAAPPDPSDAASDSGIVTNDAAPVETADAGPEGETVDDDVWGHCSPMEWRSSEAAPKLAVDTDVLDALLTPLPDGRVLVGAAESIYDPSTDTYTPLPNAAAHRDWAATAVMNDRRSVLIAGGDDGEATNMVTILDVVTGEERETTPMHRARIGQRALTLSDGRVIVIGGDDEVSGMPAAEIYDPATKTWTGTSPAEFGPDYGFASPSVAFIDEDDVLVLGRNPGCANYRLKVSTREWTKISDEPHSKIPETLVPLGSGRFMVGSRYGCHGGADTSAKASLYDGPSDTWRALADPPQFGVFQFYEDCGRVVSLTTAGPRGNEVEVYDVALDRWHIPLIEKPDALNRNDTKDATMLGDGTILWAWGELDGEPRLGGPLGALLLLAPTVHRSASPGASAR